MSGEPVVKLYIYHHCPFCLRAIMVANYKDLPYSVEYLLNDDVETPTGLIGAKQVPILRFYDYSAMAESMDIARELDDLGDPDRIIRPASDISAITSALSEAAQQINALVFPRTAALDLPEFRTQGAIDYYRRKKEQSLGFDFAQALTGSDNFKAATEAMLASLPTPELPSAHNNTISWDDVVVFPTLRNLSMVHDLKFPPQLRRYMDEICHTTSTSLYLDQAI